MRRRVSSEVQRDSLNSDSRICSHQDLSPGLVGILRDCSLGILGVFGSLLGECWGSVADPVR